MEVGGLIQAATFVGEITGYCFNAGLAWLGPLALGLVGPFPTSALACYIICQFSETMHSMLQVIECFTCCFDSAPSEDVIFGVPLLIVSEPLRNPNRALLFYQQRVPEHWCL